MLKSKCNQCGRCCKFWTITLNKGDIKTLSDISYSPNSFAEANKGIINIKMKKQNCFFLDKNNLCEIEKKHGYKYKPEVCKNFPYNQMVCGNITLSDKKYKEKKSSKYDLFFSIDKKAIESEDFSKLAGELDTKTSLFDSYSNLLYNLIKEENNIILDKIKIKEYKIKTKKLEREIERIISNISLSPFPNLTRILKKQAYIALPIQNIRINIKPYEIPENLKKQFLLYLEQAVKDSKSYLYPTYLAISLYFLPYFVNSIKKDKEPTLQEVLQAFTLLNSLHRFPSLNTKKLNYINNNLHKLIKEK